MSLTGYHMEPVLSFMQRKDGLADTETAGWQVMGDTIFSIFWYGLMIWTCLKPEGYGPYILLGFNGGDFLATMYCGLMYGYLKEDGDFNAGSFLTISVAFALLGGFYAGKLSFQPGSDAYNNALYFIFVTFWLAFGYRFLQYGLGHVMSSNKD